MFWKILLAIILIVAGLWGYGFYKGYSDVENGANLVTYKLVSSGMNPITRSGYKTFFFNFTNYNEKVDNLRDSINSLEGLFK